MAFSKTNSIHLSSILKEIGCLKEIGTYIFELEDGWLSAIEGINNSLQNGYHFVGYSLGINASS